MKIIKLSNGVEIGVPDDVTVIAPEGAGLPAAASGYGSEWVDFFHLAKGEPVTHPTNTNVDTEPVGKPYSQEITASPGGVYPLTYVDGGQQGTLIHMPVPGIIALGPFRVTPDKGGIGRVRASSMADHNFQAEIALSEKPQKLSGESVVPDGWGGTSVVPTLTFVVDRAAAGVSASLTSGVDYYVNFRVTVADDFLVILEAANRGR